VVRDGGQRALRVRRGPDPRGERLLGRVPVGRFYRNCKAAVIYEGTREIHKLMQADYALGYRQDKPRRVDLPPFKG
jgi:alkylation response protein AidB-like acyl-CoA dehydrogenase